jgi:V8-like Glu-specific endopeptidase
VSNKLKDLVAATLVVVCLVAMALLVHEVVRINRAIASQKHLPKLAPSSGISIVRLVDPETGSTFCSGTVVSDSIIITAGHCVIEEGIFGMASIRTKPIEIREYDNVKLGILARPIYAEPHLDHGLLKGDFSKLSHQPFTTDIQEINSYAIVDQEFTACGYPLGGNMYCSILKYKDKFDFMWRVEGVLLPGMSGGPVMLSNGKVIGINDAVEGNSSIISPIYNLDVEFGRNPSPPEEDKGE